MYLFVLIVNLWDDPYMELCMVSVNGFLPLEPQESHQHNSLDAFSLQTNRIVQIPMTEQPHVNMTIV